MNDKKIKKSLRSLIDQICRVLKSTITFFCPKYLLKYDFLEQTIC
ncbi:hypothetical protein COO91_00331 [Nostoc flagelliforme CCNUN1]|uniref:Uncharacterized protein n=1 Tax=Nostoc flagelliforme CCNUN1 TaxID=2038116 RepID=A0A2K8SGD7_9NOSO|nr:hypothetical protein COO91_00331 [Nostoc flagelliforme CCNUN1]